MDFWRNAGQDESDRARKSPTRLEVVIGGGKKRILARPWSIFALMAVLLGGCVTVFFSPGVRKRLATFSFVGTNAARAVLDRGQVRADSHGEYTNLIFLHHSVGFGLIRQGGLRELLSEAGFSFYDQGYNAQGLFRPDGSDAGYAYYVPGDNTDPDGLARVFGQVLFPIPINSLSGLFQHEVIVLKSCYTSIARLSESGAEQQRGQYQRIRQIMARHPGKLFIILTAPPANPAETSPEAAKQARALAAWLGSEDFRQGQANICVFDLFSLLAEDNPSSPELDMLRSAYRGGGDSHPTRQAAEMVAPILTRFVSEAVRSYRSR